MDVLFERLTDLGAGALPLLGHGLLWLAALAGLLGSLFPAFPGATLIWGAAVLHGVAYGFDPLGGWTLGILTILTGVSVGAQYVVSALGAKRFGASLWGVAAAGVGMVAGTFLIPVPVFGSLVGAFLGAVAIEYPRLKRTLNSSQDVDAAEAEIGEVEEATHTGETAMDEAPSPEAHAAAMGAARAGLGAALGAILGLAVEFGTALVMIGVLFVGFVS